MRRLFGEVTDRLNRSGVDAKTTGPNPPLSEGPSDRAVLSLLAEQWAKGRLSISQALYSPFASVLVARVSKNL